MGDAMSDLQFCILGVSNALEHMWLDVRFHLCIEHKGCVRGPRFAHLLRPPPFCMCSMSMNVMFVLYVHVRVLS